MTIGTSSRRCSYYLVLAVTLGRPGVAFPSEPVATDRRGVVAASSADRTGGLVHFGEAFADERPPSQASWTAAPFRTGSGPGDTVHHPVPTRLPSQRRVSHSTASPTQLAEPAVNPDGGEFCPENPEPAPDLPRSDTYKGMPFQPGEEARYVLKYGLLRVHVGYGFLRVMPPAKHILPVAKKNGSVILEPRWHRVFSAEAYTGDWYKMIFAAHDKMQAFSRPWDFGVTKFYISQNEEKPFVRRFHAEKWLDFDHVSCKVNERMVDHKKKREKNTEHFLQPSADDALGALYKLRTYKWELNKTERILVYTSEKNWWLEATPIAIENIKTAIGNHKAFKLAVKTYLGKEFAAKRQALRVDRRGPPPEPDAACGGGSDLRIDLLGTRPL